jgi:uncharacterized membrane protein
MRGLACLLMFQTHGYDAWLAPAARKTTFFMWSQLIGGMPAPLFLFVAGISLALLTERLRGRQASARSIAHKTIVRGAEILGLGLLFRLQQFAFNWRWAPWSDLLRVDVLNSIAVAIMLMGIGCWVAALAPEKNVRCVSISLAIAAAMGIALASPPLWTTYRPDWLPWPLESYVNGVHNFGEPQPYFFPIFPWAGFAFAGLATGFGLATAWVQRHQAAGFGLCAGLGAGLIMLARWCDRLPWHFYRVYSFWTTSPEYFLIRLGLVLLILSVAYGWCRWGAAEGGFSPVIQLGQTSLLVYWIHIELVYDRLAILPGHANSIPRASCGLSLITLSMLALSLLYTHFAGRRANRGSQNRVIGAAPGSVS